MSETPSARIGENNEVPKVSTHFYISGRDFDADECTAALGLDPSEIWRQERDELRHRSDLHNVTWSIGRDNQSSYSVSEMVEQVLDLIWARRDHIRTYVRGKPLATGVSCTVTIHQDRPVFNLSATAIRRLAELNCEFTLDIFDYSE